MIASQAPGGTIQTGWSECQPRSAGEGRSHERTERAAEASRVSEGSSTRRYLGDRRTRLARCHPGQGPTPPRSLGAPTPASPAGNSPFPSASASYWARSGAGRWRTAWMRSRPADWIACS